MPSKKKKFIDKKEGVTFRLVHRSQKDPLVTDSDAPQRVLLPLDSKLKPTAKEKSKKQKLEEQKFGIFYDDNYDYLKHLKDLNEVPEWQPIISHTRINHTLATDEDSSQNESHVQLPSSVFQSKLEEKEGLLNKASSSKGAQPDWDPSIVAALDDDYDFSDSENELEDDFVAMANCELEDGSSDESYHEETIKKKNRGTNYSMTSSVLPRSEILQTLDDRFERIVEDYDELDMGALESEDLDGHLNAESEIVQQLLQNFELSKKRITLREVMEEGKKLGGAIWEPDKDKETFEILEVHEKISVQDRMDCQSVVSNYSNLYNRPQLIKEPQKQTPIRVSEQTGLPKNVLNGGMTKSLLKQLDNEARGPKMEVKRSDETKEEKKERKLACKERQRERRTEKKANKMAFKEELIKQNIINRNIAIHSKGIKIS